MNRRKFLETSGAAAGAAMLGNVNVGQAENASPQVQKPVAAGKIKIGLYSITYGGIWYEGPALTFDELCKRAKESGFDGVELDNKAHQWNEPTEDKQNDRNRKQYVESSFQYSIRESIQWDELRIVNFKETFRFDVLVWHTRPIFICHDVIHPYACLVAKG